MKVQKKERTERNCKRCIELKLALNCDICLKYQEGTPPMPKKMREGIQQKDQKMENTTFNWLT